MVPYSRFLLFLYSTLLLLLFANGDSIHYRFNVDRTVQDYKDMQNTPRLTVNNSTHPPSINVTQGDTLILEIQNRLDQPLTLDINTELPLFPIRFQNFEHAHFPLTIGPHTNNVLRIAYPNSSPGTHILIAHAGLLSAALNTNNILAIPLIVDAGKDERYKYDAEHVLLIEAAVKEHSYTNTCSAENTTGIVNGHLHALSPHFHIDPFKVYRIRIVNANALRSVSFSIDDHVFSVIEIDGVADVVPRSVGRVDIPPFQTASVLLTGKVANDLNYRYRVGFYSSGCAGVIERYAGIIEYWPGNDVWEG